MFTDGLVANSKRLGISAERLHHVCLRQLQAFAELPMIQFAFSHTS